MAGQEKTAISTSRYDQTYSFVSSLLGCIKNLKLKDFARISSNDTGQKRSEGTARVETAKEDFYHERSVKHSNECGRHFSKLQDIAPTIIRSDVSCTTLT